MMLFIIQNIHIQSMSCVCVYDYIKTKMQDKRYIDSFTRYLRLNYNSQVTSELLVRLIFILKKLKWYDYDRIETPEFFFIVYCVFKFIKDLVVTSDSVDTIKKYNLSTSDIMDITLYIIFSYFGPEIEYPMDHFVSDKLNRAVILDIICNTNISNILLRLNADKRFVNKEIKKFLSFYILCFIYIYEPTIQLPNNKSLQSM